MFKLSCKVAIPCECCPCFSILQPLYLISITGHNYKPWRKTIPYMDFLKMWHASIFTSLSQSFAELHLTIMILTLYLNYVEFISFVKKKMLFIYLSILVLAFSFWLSWILSFPVLFLFGVYLCHLIIFPQLGGAVPYGGKKMYIITNKSREIYILSFLLLIICVFIKNIFSFFSSSLLRKRKNVFVCLSVGLLVSNLQYL